MYYSQELYLSNEVKVIGSWAQDDDRYRTWSNGIWSVSIVGRISAKGRVKLIHGLPYRISYLGQKFTKLNPTKDTSALLFNTMVL